MFEPNNCGSAIAQAVMTVDSYRGDGASGLPRNMLKHRAGTRHRLISGFTNPPHGVEALHRHSYCAQRHVLTQTFATHCTGACARRKMMPRGSSSRSCQTGIRAGGQNQLRLTRRMIECEALLALEAHGPTQKRPVAATDRGPNSASTWSMMRTQTRGLIDCNQNKRVRSSIELLPAVAKTRWRGGSQLPTLSA